MGYRVTGPHVVAEQIDGEILIVNLATGFYYSLLNAAVDVWGSVILGGNRDQIVAAMVERFGDDEGLVTGAVDELLTRLVDEQLVVDDPHLALSAPIPNEGSGSFKAPVFESFDDMKDLILLDPVHEVDPEQGWPRAKDDTRDEEPSATL